MLNNSSEAMLSNQPFGPAEDLKGIKKFRKIYNTKLIHDVHQKILLESSKSNDDILHQDDIENAPCPLLVEDLNAAKE